MNSELDMKYKFTKDSSTGKDNIVSNQKVFIKYNKVFFKILIMNIVIYIYLF